MDQASPGLVVDRRGDAGRGKQQRGHKPEVDQRDVGREMKHGARGPPPQHVLGDDLPVVGGLKGQRLLRDVLVERVPEHIQHERLQERERTRQQVM